jgi:hypothetical protein
MRSAARGCPTSAYAPPARSTPTMITTAAAHSRTHQPLRRGADTRGRMRAGLDPARGRGPPIRHPSPAAAGPRPHEHSAPLSRECGHLQSDVAVLILSPAKFQEQVSACAAVASCVARRAGLGDPRTIRTRISGFDATSKHQPKRKRQSWPRRQDDRNDRHGAVSLRPAGVSDASQNRSPASREPPDISCQGRSKTDPLAPLEN